MSSETQEIATALANFCQLLKAEISEYYDRCYSYIKDLYADKSIDLMFKTTYESDKDIKETVDAMIKTTNLALSTIGIPKKRMAKDSKTLKEIAEKKGEEYPTYNAYFEKDLKLIINNNLFEILVEYLIDWDASKIENLDLFDLLPRKFIDKLDVFKDDYITSTHLKRLINQQLPNLREIVDPTSLVVRLEGVRAAPQPEVKEIAEPTQVKPTPKPSKTEAEDMDILKQLEQAKKMNIEALKASIKKSAVPTPPIVKKTVEARPAPPTVPKETVSKAPKPVEPPISKPTPAPPVTPPPQEAPPRPVEPKIEPPTIAPPVKEVKPVELPKVEAPPESFLDYFGNFPAINPSISNHFSINTSNLLNTWMTNSDYFDLETLFYYISILKMLNLQAPFATEDILEITKNHINGTLFSTSKENKPDPLSIFYGLAIYSELKILDNTDGIDLLDIEMFLESEMSKFIPQKMHLNLFNLLSFSILQKSGAIITDKNQLLNPILGLDLTSIEEHDPVLDIYEQLTCIRLIDKNANLSHFKAIYSQNLKALMGEDGAIKQTITDSARALLIMDLLDLKKQEFNISQKILKYVVTGAKFFNMDFNKDFNWQIEALGYKVELRMLFWALLASSQYQPII